ncbi:hypothetical protein [Fimbriiglobus ruber]|uniref:Uncharacterized protein n=1 Tax=Fimbriiglobus ruber TaxID=1908690 RepID=A0A225E4A4_9BACT|nr:hypothetical protein [Fimbriiglobus ruber]OWK46584.1 hypothetical protein FRUB_00283 [Fimbriiglobus ruber]
MRQVKKAVWEELTPENNRLQWIETDRTDDYIELENVTNGVKEFARLYDGKDDRWKDNDAKHYSYFAGKWTE